MLLSPTKIAYAVSALAAVSAVSWWQGGAHARQQLAEYRAMIEAEAKAEQRRVDDAMAEKAREVDDIRKNLEDTRSALTLSQSSLADAAAALRRIRLQNNRRPDQVPAAPGASSPDAGGPADCRLSEGAARRLAEVANAADIQTANLLACQDYVRALTHR